MLERRCSRPLGRSPRRPKRRSPSWNRRHRPPRSRRRSPPRRRGRGRLDSHPHDLLPLPNRPFRPAVQGIKPRSLTECPRRDSTNLLGLASARRVASHNLRPHPPKMQPRRTGRLLRPPLQAGSAGLPGLLGLLNRSLRLLRRGLRKLRPRPRRRTHHASPRRQPVPPRPNQPMRPGRRPAPSQRRAPLAPRRPTTFLRRPPATPGRRRIKLRGPPGGPATRTSAAAGPGTCAASPYRDAQRRPSRRHRRRQVPRSARTSTVSAGRSRA